MYKDTESAHRLPYVVAAFRDVEKLLLGPAMNMRASAEEQGTQLTSPCTFQLQLASFTERLKEEIFDNIIKPLCSEIDSDLRLHIHSARLVKEAVEIDPARIGKRCLWCMTGYPFSQEGSVVLSPFSNDNHDSLPLTNAAVKDRTPILRLKEIRLYNSNVNIKWEVEKNLDVDI